MARRSSTDPETPDHRDAPESTAAEPSEDLLASAEVEAAREAEEEVAAASKVVRPRVRTSGPAHPAEPAAREPASPASDPAPPSGHTLVTATAVTVRQGGIGRVEAETVEVSQGGIGFARADRVSLERGSAGAVVAGQVDVKLAATNLVAAGEANLGKSLVRTLIARTVTVRERSYVVAIIAQRVSGDVRVLVDWRGAIALGVAFGIVTNLLRRRR